VTAYSEQLWQAAQPVYEAVLDHPFLVGLADGTLPRPAFRHFVVQDSHYLRDYARALALCAAKAPDEADLRAFAGDAVAAVEAEQSMHAEFMTELGDADPATAEVMPTTRAYTSYLIATVYGGSFLDGLAAVLPCYWIYARVGEALLTASSPDPLYARWITTYGDESFQAVVRRVVALTDRVATQAAQSERRRAADHFLTTSRYEWMFWDAAWRRERWPV
jgi:thiaminase/transcriptional activator TenA